MVGSPHASNGARADAVVGLDLADPTHVAALRTLLDAYARDPAGGGAPLSSDALERLPGVLADCPAYLGFLSFDRGEAVGILNAFVTASTFRARALLNVHDLAVIGHARGRGHGMRLLRAAEGAARERGCCKLTLEVLEGNARAIALYEHFGFAAYRLQPSMGRAVFLEKPLA